MVFPWGVRCSLRIAAGSGSGRRDVVILPALCETTSDPCMVCDRTVGGGRQVLQKVSANMRRPSMDISHIAETQFANPPSGARFMIPRSRMRELSENHLIEP